MRYPNDYARSHQIGALAQIYAGADADALEREQPIASIAGRLMGKAGEDGHRTGVVRDASGTMRILVSEEAAGKAQFAAYEGWRAGDIVGIGGILCRLATGELALRAHEMRRLVQVLRPLPEGGAAEASPYLALLLGEEAGRLFRIRSRLVHAVRAFLTQRLYVEVETPILHPAPESVARQFGTHHNALDRPLYLRRSAQMHLQTLLVGGVEQVFEINRSFENGAAGAPLSETVLELCCAFTNEHYMMAFIEGLVTVATSRVADRSLAEGPPLPQFHSPFARRSLAQGAPAPAEPAFVIEGAAFALYLAGERVAEGGAVPNDPQALSHADTEFRRAVEYGMPPASAARVSIDALVRALTGVPSLADTNLFPL